MGDAATDPATTNGENNTAHANVPTPSASAKRAASTSAKKEPRDHLSLPKRTRKLDPTRGHGAYEKVPVGQDKTR